MYVHHSENKAVSKTTVFETAQIEIEPCVAREQSMIKNEIASREMRDWAANEHAHDMPVQRCRTVLTLHPIEEML
jgi:hypothetical protein